MSDDGGQGDIGQGDRESITVDANRQPDAHLSDATPNGRLKSPGSSAEDLQDYRAYLQRGETRLSTLHRVAGAFLGGAGLLTLLPVLFRDTFSSLFSEILFLSGDGLPELWSIQRLLILAPVFASLLLPVWSLYLLMGDLIRFYFTGHHFGSQTGKVYPRFILSGILVSDQAHDDRQVLRRARLAPSVTELLVPRADSVKRRLLREAHVLGGCRGVSESDIGRPDGVVDHQLREFIFDYTASMPRSLAEESAKMEASTARHLIRLRVLVVRYAKAFLLTILTTGTTITALVVLNLGRTDIREGLGRPETEILISGQLIWMGLLAVYAAWCLAAGWLVRRPIVWIYDDLANKNVLHRTPESLLLFETVTLIVVVLSGLCVGLATWSYAADSQDANLRWIATAITLIILSGLIYVGRAFRENYVARKEGRAA